MRRARSFSGMHLWPAGILPRFVRVVLRAALISLALTYSFGGRAQTDLSARDRDTLNRYPSLRTYHGPVRLSDFAARKRRYGA